ncbi:hypothetical protein BX666DRAFT_1900427 [Dichotomocladium elegans]|nr:hypothetical protein BX666DRAFT_1900427 [Dichotomocladium elegans]
MTQEGYHKRNGATITWYVFHLILTVLQFPTPFVGRQGLRTEETRYMALFLTMHGLLVIDFVIILQQSAGSWVFWVIAVCLAIVLCIVSICLGSLVTQNFNKGLKPYVQRLFDENFRYNLDPTANPTYYEKPQREVHEEPWAIDDFDDDDEGSFAYQQQPLTPRPEGRTV